MSSLVARAIRIINGHLLKTVPAFEDPKEFRARMLRLMVGNRFKVTKMGIQDKDLLSELKISHVGMITKPLY